MLHFEKLFSIKTNAQFAETAMETFRFQATNCAPYREYLEAIECRANEVTAPEQIPFMPIELFKWRDIYCGQQPEAVFTSSNTGGTVPARHMMQSLSLYEQAFTTAFDMFYGDPSQLSIYALLPSYLQREGSSLVYMSDCLIRKCGSGGFYLDNYHKLLDDMAKDPKPKILLGVTYALLDLAESFAPKLHNTIVMETGGMKGHREELPKEELHTVLCNAFGVESIHSEYGMAELTSQAYSSGGGLFRTPPWMRITIRDVNDPFDTLPPATRGGINITDLANRWSCAFIQTQDRGILYADGSFRIEGRIDNSDIRGCNLLVQ